MSRGSRRGSILSFSAPEVTKFTCRRERETDLRRGSRQERGYSSDWEKVATEFRKANPLCAECLRKDRVTVADLVDHVLPLRDFPDLRLETSNLQSLCSKHHALKTAMEIFARKSGSLEMVPEWVRAPSTRPARFR
jgi:5-methylcytosine-specific restriction endonuclease McrA